MNEPVFPATSQWRSTLIACIVVLAGLLLLFWPTAEGMIGIWYRSETYAHGFIILPITLWLIWQKRQHLAAFSPQPTPALLLLLGGALIGWALARLTGVLVVEQFAFVAVLISAVASLLGWQVTRFLLFPLLFLFFMVPMGEDLIPPMMEFTATFTVEALKLTGIPVYREGLWFSLPSGNWSVVEACSGVRYLIASATLGVMYAYITYHTLWKRLLFIAFSVLVPVLANGLRAYMIVMIGHLSDMEYATGVDHLLYGWVFFGIVMFILFWVGSLWQEQQEPPRVVQPPRDLSRKSVDVRLSVVTAAVLLVSAAAVWTTSNAEDIEMQMAGQLTAPDGKGGWSRLGEPAPWSAAHQPTAQKIEAGYQREDDRVQLHVLLYPQQRHGAEAINQANAIATALVRQSRLGQRTVVLGDEQVRINQGKALIPIDGVAQEYLVWQWYRLAGHNLSNRYLGKAHEALARLYPGRADGAWIAISTPMDPLDAEQAERRLAAFAQTMTPEIGNAIDAALGLVD